MNKIQNRAGPNVVGTMAQMSDVQAKAITENTNRAGPQANTNEDAD